MSLHTELDIFKASYDLLGVADDLVRDIPRAHKPHLGRKIFDECTDLVAAIPLANAERGAAKVPHINQLLQRLEVAKVLFRLCVDKRYISHGQFARTVPLTTYRQAGPWLERSSASSPAA
jgi:hypothetical protein